MQPRDSGALPCRSQASSVAQPATIVCVAYCPMAGICPARAGAELDHPSGGNRSPDQDGMAVQVIDGEPPAGCPDFIDQQRDADAARESIIIKYQNGARWHAFLDPCNDVPCRLIH